MKRFNWLLVGILFIACFSGCKKWLPEDEFPVNTNFVSATLVATLTKSELDAKAHLHLTS